jgi:hypothetical protein
MWFICAMEYYLALKRKEILIHATIWVNFEDIMQNRMNDPVKNDKSV